MFEIRKDGYAVYSGQRERAEGFVGTDSATVYEVTANGLKEVDKIDTDKGKNIFQMQQRNGVFRKITLRRGKS